MVTSSDRAALKKLIGVQPIAVFPKPLLAISYPEALNEHILATLLWELSLNLGQLAIKGLGQLVTTQDAWKEAKHTWDGAGARCVALHRLPAIMQTGVDVTPTTAPLFVDCIENALEYGGPHKVLMLFKREALDKTFREVDATIDPTELASLRATFPTMDRSRDGTKLWLSRLPAADRRRAKSYEFHYGRWIPGDPWNALLAIFVLGTDAEVLIPFIRGVQRECHAVCWQ